MKIDERLSTFLKDLIGFARESLVLRAFFFQVGG